MSNDCLLRLENEDERLLPGLPDDIILDQIVPRLPWTAFHVLGFVSRSWRRAIRSRQVYDARVRSHSTETIILLDSNIDETMVLYSMRDDSWHQLPKLPKPSELSFQRVPLDGKIYILGEESSEIYVLDVAGQEGWKPCANIPQQRFGFHCGVIDGKIYVVMGGHYSSKPTSDGKSTSACLVYDPKENAWSSTMPRNYKHKQYVTDFVTFGGELFVHGGDSLSEVYHPGRDEWRLVKHFGLGEGAQMLITAHGKLLMMTQCSPEMGIYAHDVDSDGNYSWTLLHSSSCSYPDIYSGNSVESYLDYVFVPQGVGGELLALLVSAYTEILYQSKGFGGEEKEIAWESVPSEVLKDIQFPYCMRSIQL